MKVSGPLRAKSLSALRLRINAAGRMANAADVVEMFLTSDDEHALRLATELHDLNKERQDTEAEIVKLIHEICDREPVTDTRLRARVFGRRLAPWCDRHRRQPDRRAVPPAGFRPE